MRSKWAFRALLFWLLLAVVFGLGWPLRVIHAQGSSGYTKIATNITGTSYTDTTCKTNGTTCGYQVTAVNAAGLESLGTAAQAQATVPASGTHTGVALTWNASTTAGVTYNVYTSQVNPPTGLAAASN